MTYKEKFKQSKDWKLKVFLVSQFHSKQVINTRKWTLRKTARYFGVSVGLISENLNLARIFDSIEACHSRAQAVMIMRGLR